MCSENISFLMKRTCTTKRVRRVAILNNATHMRSVHIWVKQTQNLPEMRIH